MVNSHDRKLIYSDNYRKLLPLFVEGGLEVHLNDEMPENLITCIELVDAQSDELIGGAAVVRTDGRFVLKCLAVDDAHQGKRLGSDLVREVISEVERNGGTELWLSAKTPGFYRKLGFATVPMEEAPPVSKCLTCPRYQVDCNSEIMVYKL